MPRRALGGGTWNNRSGGTLFASECFRWSSREGSGYRAPGHSELRSLSLSCHIVPSGMKHGKVYFPKAIPEGRPGKREGIEIGCFFGKPIMEDGSRPRLLIPGAGAPSGKRTPPSTDKNPKQNLIIYNTKRMNGKIARSACAIKQNLNSRKFTGDDFSYLYNYAPLYRNMIV